MNKKQVIAIFVLILLLNSLFAVAQTTSSDSSGDTSSCNWWCKIKAVFGGNVVGKAPTPPPHKTGDLVKDNSGKITGIYLDDKVVLKVGDTYHIKDYQEQITVTGITEYSLKIEISAISAISAKGKSQKYGMDIKKDALAEGIEPIDSVNGKHFVLSSTTVPEPTPTPEPTAATTPPSTGAAAPDKNCASIEECQTKVKNGEITHGEAYDALDQLATTHEKDAAIAKETQEAFLKSFQAETGVKLTADGKVPSSVNDDQLAKVATKLGLSWYQGSDPTSALQDAVKTTIASSKLDSATVTKKYDDNIKSVQVAYKVLPYGFTPEEEKTFLNAVQKNSGISPKKDEKATDYFNRVIATIQKQQANAVKSTLATKETTQAKLDSIKQYLDPSGNLKSDLTDANLQEIATKLSVKIDNGESKDSFLKKVNAALDDKTDPKAISEKEKLAKETRESADSMHWQGTWLDNLDNQKWYQTSKGIGSILSGGFELVGSLGSYRALSNLLFPDTTKAWSDWANKETLTRWADLPNFAAAKACKEDDAKRANRPGQAAAFITTTAGTDQAVGAINAEKSPTKFPLLCRKNKAEEWVCPKDLVCKDNTYCYKDKNADKPEEGYFYKITWGVTAPSDEKFTPYVDEDGVAAKFNVYLDDKPLYVKKSITEPKQVLQLTNGGHDGGMIVRYLPTDYANVCIRFDKPIKDIGSDDINEICASIISTTGGVVEYAGSSKAETVTSTSADVELDI